MLFVMPSWSLVCGLLHPKTAFFAQLGPTLSEVVLKLGLSEKANKKIFLVLMIIFPLRRPAGIAILQSLQIQVLIEKKTLHFYYLQEIIKGQEISE